MMMFLMTYMPILLKTQCICKYNCPPFYSGAPGAGEWETKLLLLQVQP